MPITKKLVNPYVGSSPRGRNKPARLLLHVAMAALLSIVVGISAACGSSTSSSGVTTRATPLATVPAEFDALPRYPGSTPVGQLDVQGPVVTRSFEAPVASAKAVLDFYASHLEGWTSIEPPHALTDAPDAAWRGQWQHNGATLTVSSERAQTLGSDVSQYSLSLRAD
jgi:hypothetical protein